MRKKIILLFFTFCVAKASLCQNLDSVINIKPTSTITKDTLYRNNKYNRIDFDEKGNIIALGNVDKNGTRNGFWIYYSSLNHKQICIGQFKNGLKNGWWFQNFNDCNIKYKNDEQVKKRCKY